MEKFLGTNWKTTAAALTSLIPGSVQVGAGAAALLHLTVPGVTVTDDPWILIGHGFTALSAALPVVLVGVLAKDGDVTGGTRKQ
jgi:hypothetical protein